MKKILVVSANKKIIETVKAVCKKYSAYFDATFFSDTDNRDEKATGLYCVIGNITDYFPHILTRASVGGNFVNLAPSELFEMIDTDYPDDWQNLVSVKPKEKDGGQTV